MQAKKDERLIQNQIESLKNQLTELQNRMNSKEAVTQPGSGQPKLTQSTVLQVPSSPTAGSLAAATRQLPPRHSSTSSVQLQNSLSPKPKASVQNLASPPKNIYPNWWVQDQESQRRKEQATTPKVTEQSIRDIVQFQVQTSRSKDKNFSFRHHLDDNQIRSTLDEGAAQRHSVSSTTASGAESRRQPSAQQASSKRLTTQQSPRASVEYAQHKRVRTEESPIVRQRVPKTQQSQVISQSH